MYVDHQDLEPGQNLILDPRSCRSLRNLTLLDISGNRMLSLKPVEEIKSLQILNAADNSLGKY